MKPDSIKQPPNKTLNRLTDLIFYSVMFVFIVALAFPHNPAGNWYQQFMPNIGGRTISDVFFLDSLTGWAVTNATNQNPDTTFVLKTTNSGDSWVIQYRRVQIGGGFPGYTKIYFLNQTTGYASSVTGFDKTTNGGANWTSLFAGETFQDISIISNDTIWIVSGNPFTGGVFRTTNGGSNWEQQLNLGSQNPNHIYMFNGSIGFISSSAGLYKTSNSGINWALVQGGAFLDMYFSDSLTGWKNNGVATMIQKTTNGGLNWTTYSLPPEEGIIILSRLKKFDNIFKDTLYGVGSDAFFGAGQFRGLIYKSTDSGSTWGYQIPDTSIHSGQFQHVQFKDKMKGWAYWNSGGVHTINGGDTTIYVTVHQISTEVPQEFVLYQNYPNPFNPVTNIKYAVKGETSNVKLVVFDISGKEITNLVNQEQSAGIYETTFDGSKFASGIYFYSLIIDNKIIDTKKIILIK